MVKLKSAAKKRKRTRSKLLEEKERRGNNNDTPSHSSLLTGEGANKCSVKKLKASTEPGSHMLDTSHSPRMIDLNFVFHTYDKSSFEAASGDSIQDELEDQQEEVELEALQPYEDGIEFEQDGLEPDQDGLEPDQDGMEPDHDGMETDQEGEDISGEEDCLFNLKESAGETQETFTQEDQRSSCSELSDSDKQNAQRPSCKKISLRLKKRAHGHTKKNPLGLVGVRNEISEEDFQLMLQGKMDVWAAEGPQVSDPVDDSPTLKEATETKDSKMACTRSTTSPHELPDLLDRTLIPREGLVSCGPEAESPHSGNLVALILTPTRELAIQVHSHIKAVAKYTGVKVRGGGNPLVCMPILKIH